MDDIKKITVLRAGGGASTEADVMPKETVEQLIKLVAEHLGLPANGNYQLLGANGTPITGDVFEAVNDGDKVQLAQIGTGGA